jgi:acyl-CoA thioesterase-1
LLVFAVLLLILVLLVVSQALIIAFNGKRVPVPGIPRETIIGSGPPLRYVVMGDSAAIGQGANYKDGIAYQSAKYLSRHRRVELANLGISGAIASEVLRNQATSAATLRPDIVLVCVGANDVTHLSRLGTIEKSIAGIIATIQEDNPATAILLTGAPAMGSVPRFPLAVKFLAGLRTRQVNRVIQKTAQKKGVTRLKIAEKTGPIFRKNPRLFARDKFHPNAQGYALWLKVITDQLPLKK